MRVKPLRALSCFSTGEGFEVGWASKGAFAFVRPSALEDLFEQIIVDSAGKRHEAVSAYAAVSVVRGRSATKGLIELEVIRELASVPDRGYSTLLTTEAAADWEKRLAAIAPAKTSMLAHEKGPTLLNETARARAVVSTYLELMPRASSLEELHRGLIQRASPEHIERARRLANWPGVLRFSGGALLYEAATLALVVLEDQVDGYDSSLSTGDPLEDRELMCRIQLMADRLSGLIDGQVLALS